MENLHLKNLKPRPNPLIILKKLNNPDYCYSKYIPEELIKEIELYIKSLTFKNKEVETFILRFLDDLTYDNIKWVLTITQQIIILLAKYKLNELDEGDYFDFENNNKEIYELESFRRPPTNKTEIEYDASAYIRFELGIFGSKEEKNKISKIYKYKW
jgi:hypothetical protein